MTKQVFIFIGGTIFGAFLAVFIIFATVGKTTITEMNQVLETLVKSLSEEVKLLDKEPEVQYVEVKGKNGVVSLYTGMTKDSAQTLLGKPDLVNLHSIFEEWSYKIDNKHGLPEEFQLPDLIINFQEGKLSAVKQQ